MSLGIAGPQYPESSPWETRRLRSLWDMLQLHAGPFVDALGQVATLTQALTMFPPAQGMQLPRSQFDQFKIKVEQFHKTCLEIGLVMCAASSDRFLAVIKDAENQSVPGLVIQIPPHNLAEMRSYTTEIVNRIKDELASRLLFIVPAESAVYYEQTIPLFGADFATKFPTAQYDLSEAGKCLALGRSTSGLLPVPRTPS